MTGRAKRVINFAGILEPLYKGVNPAIGANRYLPHFSIFDVTRLYAFSDAVSHP